MTQISVDSKAIGGVAKDLSRAREEGTGDLFVAGSGDAQQNQIEKPREKFEEALETHRELAHKEPDIYLRYVAITLNNLANQNRPLPFADSRERLPSGQARSPCSGCLRVAPPRCPDDRPD
jgi:hypothetical protein